MLAATIVTGSACGRSGELDLVTGIRVNTRVVDANNNPGFFADMKVDPTDGQPAIAYYALQSGDLRYAKLNPGTAEWEIIDVDEDGDVGGYPQLQFTQTGRPHIIYYDFTNARLKYAVFNGLEWEPQNLPFAERTEGYVAMKLDRNEIAHIATVDKGNFNLQYLVYDHDTRALGGLVADDGTLTNQRGGNINAKMTVELRAVGNEFLPAISYYNASLGVLNLTWVERQPNGGLAFTNPPRTIDGRLTPGAADVGQWVSTVLSNFDPGNDDGSGVIVEDMIHFSYYDGLNNDLKYASYRWSTTETTIERIDSDGIVGETSSITIDRLGRPTISYYDSTNNDLKIAFRTPDGRWFLNRVDLQGIVGSFSSIGLMPLDGSIGIAYRDTSREALKFSIVRTQ